MLKKRLAEYVEARAKMKELDARQKRAVKEIAELLAKEGVAFDESSVEFEGFRLTEVGGETSTIDKRAIMSAYDLTPEEFEAAFVTKKAKKRYLKITAPGEREGEE